MKKEFTVEMLEDIVLEIFKDTETTQHLQMPSISVYYDDTIFMASIKTDAMQIITRRGGVKMFLDMIPSNESVILDANLFLNGKKVDKETFLNVVNN